MFLGRLSALAVAALFVLGAAQLASADQVSDTTNPPATGWNDDSTSTAPGTTSEFFSDDKPNIGDTSGDADHGTWHPFSSDGGEGDTDDDDKPVVSGAPEPSSLLLLGSGLSFLRLAFRRRHLSL